MKRILAAVAISSILGFTIGIAPYAPQTSARAQAGQSAVHMHWLRWCKHEDRCSHTHPWVFRSNPVIRHERWYDWCEHHSRCQKNYHLNPPTLPLSGTGCDIAAEVAYNAGIRNETDLIQMVAFAIGESGCTLVQNTSLGGCCFGAWQISYVNGYDSQRLLYDWAYNGYVAARLSDNGTNWIPWTGDPEYGCVDGGWCDARAYAAVQYALGAG